MSLFAISSSAVGTSQLSVNTQVNGGGILNGFYTVLYRKGNVVTTGYTPATFTLTNGKIYGVEVQGFGKYYFQYWLATGSVNPIMKISISAASSETAVLCKGPPGTCHDPVPKNGITVYAHRIPASYWAPCFAPVCSAGTGPGASMYFVLYNASGHVVGTGYSDEAGYTFTGLKSGVTYYVYPEDCDLCHGSTHNVIFRYWDHNSSSMRPLAATV